MNFDTKLICFSEIVCDSTYFLKIILNYQYYVSFDKNNSKIVVSLQLFICGSVVFKIYRAVGVLTYWLESLLWK